MHYVFVRTRNTDLLKKRKVTHTELIHYTVFFLTVSIGTDVSSESEGKPAAQAQALCCLHTAPTAGTATAPGTQLAPSSHPSTLREGSYILLKREFVGDTDTGVLWGRMGLIVF